MFSADSVPIALAKMTRITDFTEDGRCSNCGQCCGNILPLTADEVRTIHRYIRKHQIREEKIFLPTALPTVNMICPFRNEREKKCNIYAVRPLICKAYQCDKAAVDEKMDPALLKQERRTVWMREEFFPKEG